MKSQVIPCGCLACPCLLPVARARERCRLCASGKHCGGLAPRHRDLRGWVRALLHHVKI